MPITREEKIAAFADAERQLEIDLIRERVDLETYAKKLSKAIGWKRIWDRRKTFISLAARAGKCNPDMIVSGALLLTVGSWPNDDVNEYQLRYAAIILRLGETDSSVSPEIRTGLKKIHQKDAMAIQASAS